jgi:hypothetical protein
MALISIARIKLHACCGVEIMTYHASENTNHNALKVSYNKLVYFFLECHV